MDGVVSARCVHGRSADQFDVQTREVGYCDRRHDMAVEMATANTYYQGLYEIAAAINSTLDRDTVMQTFAQKVTMTLRAKGCSVLLLSPDKKELLHTATYALSDSYIREGSLSSDKSICETIEGKVVAVLNAPEDDRVQYRDEKMKEGIVSI